MQNDLFYSSADALLWVILSSAHPEASRRHLWLIDCDPEQHSLNLFDDASVSVKIYWTGIPNTCIFIYLSVISYNLPHAKIRNFKVWDNSIRNKNSNKSTFTSLDWLAHYLGMFSPRIQTTQCPSAKQSKSLYERTELPVMVTLAPRLNVLFFRHPREWQWQAWVCTQKNQSREKGGHLYPPAPFTTLYLFSPYIYPNFPVSHGLSVFYSASFVHFILKDQRCLWNSQRYSDMLKR